MGNRNVMIFICFIVVFYGFFIIDCNENKSVDLGIRIIPAGEIDEWTHQSFVDAFELAKKGGFNFSINSFYWGDNERNLGKYKWDYHEANRDWEHNIVKENGFIYSPIIEIIHTNMLGEYPKNLKFKRFDDPVFINSFKKYIKEFIGHFKDIEYIWIGNEVDFYLHDNPEKKKQFIKFFKEVVKEVHKIDKNIIIGTVCTYHLARKTGEISFVRELGEIGDALALTVYIEDDREKQDVKNTEKYFDKLFNDFPGIKIAIIETAWSNKGEYGSSYNQMEYIKKLSNVVEKYEDNLIFLSWFILHDLSPGINKKAGESFGIKGNSEFVEKFLKWQGSLGLINSDGIEKPAWNIWIEEFGE